ncbi:hypothetical protein JW826_05430 [Candidatus Woesearchaeota archaeon]|nr:hypothetical protein [Candidatus Woesearchaeota archaeon]
MPEGLQRSDGLDELEGFFRRYDAFGAQPAYRPNNDEEMYTLEAVLRLDDLRVRPESVVGVVFRSVEPSVPSERYSLFLTTRGWLEFGLAELNPAYRDLLGAMGVPVPNARMFADLLNGGEWGGLLESFSGSRRRAVILRTDYSKDRVLMCYTKSAADLQPLQD